MADHSVFTPHRCLIVAPSWVGDMIMAQSLFIELKRQFPDMLIDVLAPEWSEPLLAAMPEVNISIVMPLGHGELGLKKRYQLGKKLRLNHYDWAILLPNSLKSALVPFWAKIPKRTGYKGEMRYGLLNDLRQLDKQALTMTVQRFVALAHYPHPIQAPDYLFPQLQLEQKIIDSALSKFSIDTNQPYIALCPGAEYGAAKRWPEHHYAHLAGELSDQGYQVVLLGSHKDQSVGEKIVQQLDKENDFLHDLTGKTELGEVIALLKQATAVVSNDSGLMHVAAAMQTPLVALYGSSDPNFTPPLSKNNRVISLGLSCSPCFKRKCPLGTLACLEGITPASVLAEINTLFEAHSKNQLQDSSS